MLVLSINFGHDASICLLKNGELLDFLEIERESRLKSHLGIASKRIENYLFSNEVSWTEIDFVCVSGTQHWGSFASSEFTIQYGYTQEHTKYFEPSPIWDLKYFAFGNRSDNDTFSE